MSKSLKTENLFIRQRISSNKQYISDDITSEDTLLSEIQEIGWDLSMMKMCYDWTKRKTKTEKIGKFLKMFNINFTTIRYKLTATGKFIQSIFNYKLIGPFLLSMAT